MGDVGVIQEGQDLALRLEAGDHLAGLHPGLDLINVDIPLRVRGRVGRILCLCSLTEGRQHLNFSEWDRFLRADYVDPDDPFPKKTLSERIADEIRARMESLRGLASSSVDLRIWYDQSELIRASVGSVRDAIAIGVAIAVAILWLFLRNARITLVTAAMVPVLSS